jgi:hypothetical protein
MERLLEPELLDHLPAQDPRAIASRRDLTRINWIMGSARIMARAVCTFPQPRRIVDLGSGDGCFALAVAKRLARHWPDVTVTLVDKQNIVAPETRARFEALGWQCETAAADIFAYLARGEAADIVTANLFLHHFDDAALARLLASLAQTARGFVACEPRRSPLALLGSKFVFALGCNGVSRHDAVASVRAGFTGHELSALWPEPRAWNLRERAAFPFTHLFTARRYDA